VLAGEEPFDEMTMIDDEDAPDLAERPLPGHPVHHDHGETPRPGNGHALAEHAPAARHAAGPISAERSPTSDA
jgi:hypothetical protein